MADLNTIRKCHGTVENNGKKKISQIEVVGKIKSEGLRDDTLYIFTDVGACNLTVHANTSIFNHKLLQHLLNFMDIHEFIKAADIGDIGRGGGTESKYSLILETDILSKLLNLEIGNIIVFKNGIRRQVVSMKGGGAVCQSNKNVKS